MGLVSRFHLWWKSLSTWRRHSRADCSEKFPHGPPQWLGRIHIVYPVKQLRSEVTALPDFLIWQFSSNLHAVQQSLPIESWFFLSRPTFMSLVFSFRNSFIALSAPVFLPMAFFTTSLSSRFSQTGLNSHSPLAKNLPFSTSIPRFSASFLWIHLYILSKTDSCLSPSS